jgi:hypothetical protein
MLIPFLKANALVYIFKEYQSSFESVTSIA